VSFFGPLYASYVVFGLDRGDGEDKYQNALITGNSKDFLWFLSRDTSVSDAVKADFVNQAKDLGYKTEDLVWVDQTQNQGLASAPRAGDGSERAITEAKLPADAFKPGFSPA
jgi:apolipoprotein D and lipocalin family protein